MILNLLFPPQTTFSCFPQNIFYRISFPTWQRICCHQPVRFLICQTSHPPLPRSFHCRLHRLAEGRSCEGKQGNFYSPCSPGGARKMCWTAQPASRSFCLSPKLLYARGEDSRKLESFVVGQSCHSRGNSCLWLTFQRIQKKHGRSQPGSCPSPK